MSIRKILLSVAAGAVGLGTMLWARDKKDPPSPAPAPAAWLRASRLAEKQDHALGIVADGEFVWATDVKVLKIGDGATPWRSLAYINGREPVGILLLETGAALLLEDGSLLLLARAGDLETFCALARRLAGDRVQARRLGLRARETALGLDWRVIVDGVVQAYRDALGPDRPRSPAGA